MCFCKCSFQAEEVPLYSCFSTRFKYHEWMLNLTTFSARIDRIMWCFVSLLHMVHVDFTIQNWIWFPGTSPQPWLWLTILQCCWIPFANVFLRVCMSAFIQEYGFFYSKIICPVLSFFIFLVGEEESTFASFPWQQTDSLLCSWCGTRWRWNPEPHTCRAPAALLNYTPPPPPPQWTSKGKPLAPLSQKTLPCETGP